MLPRTIDLFAHCAQIIEQACTNVPYDEIAKRLQNLYKIAINKRTLQRRLQQQSVKVKTIILNTPLLRAQIAILFRLGNIDEKTLEDLINMGYQLSIQAIIRIKKEIGLIRRINVFNKKAIDEQIFKVLQRELDNRRIASYKQRHLHVYFRQQGYLVIQQLFSLLYIFKFTSYYQKSLLMRLLICKDSLFAMLHVLNPTKIILRRRKIQAKKGKYIMLNLNQI